MTAVGNGLADREAQTSALDVIVELDETFKHRGLLLMRNTSASILAVDIHAIVLQAVAYFDMTIMGVFHRISNEIDDDLLDALLVEAGGKRIVGVVTYKLHSWILSDKPRRRNARSRCPQAPHATTVPPGMMPQEYRQ